MNLFEINNLFFSYPGRESPALNDISFSVTHGEFVVICGKSGGGKTTLLRHLKPALTPHGERIGEITFKGKPIALADTREQAAAIGFVQQNPDRQIVTDKVWHELAFGLESLGADKDTIRLRVAEMASFFGIQTWYHRSVLTLSGGQKQLLNLAAIMTMQPDVLILDEPTSQLDPIAASEFLAAIRKINTEIGTTIILSEHRLEEALPLATRILVISDGKISADGLPLEVGHQLKIADDPMLYAMPTPMRVYFDLQDKISGDQQCPLSTGEGRHYLMQLNLMKPNSTEPDIYQNEHIESDSTTVVEVKNAWFRYEKSADDVLRGLDLSVRSGELFCIVGGNGTGKTTALGVVSGLIKPYRGKVTIKSEMMALLPQDPQTLFTHNTIREELEEMLPFQIRSNDEGIRKLTAAAEAAEITDLMDVHPYDVSGGEQQRAAIAKILLLKPELLLLDEPTKGMDSFYKRKLADILLRLRQSGMTILMVSHDLEFCAHYADRCALFFDGGIVTQNEPRSFFSGNSFYTTAANRMSRGMLTNAITVEDVVEKCRKKAHS